MTEILKKKIYFYFKEEGIFNEIDIYEVIKKINEVCEDDDSPNIKYQKQEVAKIVQEFEDRRDKKKLTN